MRCQKCFCETAADRMCGDLCDCCAPPASAIGVKSEQESQFRTITITIRPATGEIDGQASLTLPPGQGVFITCGGLL
jgi:hypothetical protein